MKRILLTGAVVLVAVFAVHESVVARRRTPAAPVASTSERTGNHRPPVQTETASRSMSSLPSPVKTSRDQHVKRAEEAPLPRSLAGFPQTEQVAKGWKAVRDLDIFGFGEQYNLTYLNILADLQECARGQLASRGKIKFAAHWALVQQDHFWKATLQSIEPEDSALTEEDDQVVLGCLQKNIGLEIPLDDNKSGEDSLTAHWGIAVPIRESRIYGQILSGGFALPGQ